MIASHGWKPFTRTEAVAALRLMIGSSGRDPAQYALHSGRIGGATQLAVQGVPELQIQRAGRWKSRAFMTYVRDVEACPLSGYIFFPTGNDLLFTAKKIYINGSDPRVPSEASRHRPPTGLKLGSEDSTVSRPYTFQFRP